MVDISDKLRRIKEMVDRGDYFTINRARQFGKTTTLNQLEKTLFNEYICIRTSFEGIGEEPFEKPGVFCAVFMELVRDALRFSSAAEDAAYIDGWVEKTVTDFKLLSMHIDKMCRGRRVVLMIDEVDKNSNNRVYIHFLGMLREKYLERKAGRVNTFQSVILAGVYDIKNIKLKLINEGVYSPAAAEGKLYNSPWNIATDFTVDMSFNPEEIATMLFRYEGDYRTGMNIAGISREIYEYSSGYPFLVSRICKLIDERFDRDWTADGVRKAVRYLIKQENNTLSDDIIKNLEAYPDLYQLIYDLLIVRGEISYSERDPVVSYGREEFIIELKVWRGEAAHGAGYEQLANYLRSRGREEGYLLTFDFRGESRCEPKEEWVTVPSGGTGAGDLRIFDIVL
jgi:hypothetical protein